MPNKKADELDVELERDGFVRDVLRELSGTLQDVVGLDEAAGFVSLVGRQIGERLDRQYRDAWRVSQLSREQVPEALVDLKRRIHGKFRIVQDEPDHILLENERCPFEDRVHGRPALCMMTSNVFGTIAAENLGYSKVVLEETIAEGHGRCLVRVHLRPSPEESEGREYFAAGEE